MMNETLMQQISDFNDSVAHYLKMEYDLVYYERFTENYNDFFDFVGSYYMGGSTVPDTARYVVEFILMRSRS